MREHKRPKHCRAVPRDERAEASIEKGLADRLNIGEVKTHAAGGFQRLGDPVVDLLLRVDSRPHPRAKVAHPNDLHRRATRCRVPFVASPCAASFGPRPVSASASRTASRRRPDALSLEIYRQWPEGYDPLSKGEKPYQLPTDRSVHGKLALPPLEGPTAPKQRQWLAPRACGAPVSDRPTYCGRWVLSSRSRSTPRSLSRLVGAVRWSAAG